MTHEEDLKAAAHAYVERGWRVIQLHKVGPDGKTCSCRQGGKCASQGKHPIELEWQKTERYSHEDVDRLWDGVWAKANVGIATGTPSGFWVLDIDPGGGGFDSMQDIVAARGKLPETFVAQTGSGGYHYFFQMPEGMQVRNTQGKIAPGIDTRGTGGQIVVAPSRSAKGDYTIAQDLPIAKAPQWLLDLVVKAEADELPIITAEELPKPEDIDPADWERCNRYAQTVIDAELTRLDRLKAEGWNGAPWNGTTFEVSCALLEIANSPWNAYSTGQAQADVLARAPRDSDGFDDWTVKKTFESARTKVGQQARAVPVDRTSEPDPLFQNPEIRRRPTEGDGSETDPATGHEVTEYDFFEGKDLLAAKLARSVADIGPIGWGSDNDFWSYEGGAWKPDHYVVQNRVIRLLGDKYRTGHYGNAKDIVRYQALPITGDPDGERINFTNGMLHWRTGELEPHAPEFGSTVQLGVPYEPEAVCPRFDAFLADVMHEDYVALAWEMIGYLMYSGNPHQVAFMLYGSGGNGKGTLLRVIQALLGPQNVASESLDDLNGNRFRTANLFGKIANLAGDIDATYQEQTASFKAITGEDLITAERKGRDPFKFVNWAVPVFSANKFPGSADVTKGYLRRWIILHFHKQIDEGTPGFSDLLTLELPGIAAKAIPALRAVMDRQRFDPTGEALKGKEEFAEAIDQVRQWVASGVPLQAPEGYTSVVDLYLSYSGWAERSGRRKVTESEFSHRLEAAGYPMEKIGGLDHHKGLTAPINHIRPTPQTIFN